MLIEKAEIERVKRANDLVELVRGRGIELKRKGKQLVGKCPFHEDHEPSLIVDPKKQLWNCLGACREGGDVYRFVMKLDGLDFRSAHLRLGGRDITTPGCNGDRSSKSAREGPKPDPAWLPTVVEHYHQALLQTPEAVDYLKSRSLGSLELFTTFKIGYADGSLLDLLSSDGKHELTSLGVLRGSGRELLHGCVVFPLVAPGSGQVLSLYGRSVQGRRHLYLPGERRGIFNAEGAQTAGDVILTESVIDAAALWAAGIRNAIPIYGINGLTEDIVNHLEGTRVRRVTLVLDSDQAGRAAATRLSERLAVHFEVRSVELEAKDPAEFLAAGGSADEIRERIREAWQPAATSASTVEPNDCELRLEHRDGALILRASDREYRARGLAAVGLDRLRVNLRVKTEKGFHLDTIDLYQARSRSSFAQAASTATGLPEARIAKDLLELVDRLEEERLRMRREDRHPDNEPTAMTDQDRSEALEFLRSPDLIERIAADFEAAGLVGERAGALVAYLAAVSRKLTKPLSVLIVARTGAGKSSLQDALCSLLPPEEVVRVTRLTGQALFYKDPDSLKGKVLAIAEEEGAAQAVYSLRTLASDQWLSIAATRTDPQTGKLHTEHYEIHGPVSIVITTTSTEAFDEETRSRFIPLTLNESVEQTRAILARQRSRHTLDGALAEAGAENVRKRHHHAQRLLRPLRVVNPYVDRLTYPEDRLIARREQEKYLTLINVIAYLRQYRKEVKRASREDVEIEYVEVGPEDIALANELAREVLWRGWDELAPPVRGMKRELERLYAKRACEQGIEPAAVGMTRREIREAVGWSDWQVRMYCQRLVEMEYLILAGNGNGRPCQYYLARPEEADEPRLTGLVDVVQKAAAKEKTPEGREGGEPPCGPCGENKNPEVGL
ncbi:MAG: toprim domain-containing protein [Acidobacteria bacterium]|nr:MAG: toprim domain-containing protein [Acidobacteriota bacterium]